MAVVRRSSLAFAAGFPAAIGAVAVAVAGSRSGTSDGAFPFGIALITLGAALLALGESAARDSRVSPGSVFGLRTTELRLADVSEARFGMVFPSISYAVTLRTDQGRRVVLHANWWTNEPEVMRLGASQLDERTVQMDRGTRRVLDRYARRPETLATALRC